MKKFRLLTIGTSGIDDPESVSRIILVNSISLAVTFSIVIVGSAISYFLDWRLSVVVPLTIEFIINWSVIVLNYYRKHKAASLVLYFLQCTAITYFGFLLIRLFHLEFVIILLVAIIYLIFKETLLRRLALIGASIVLLLLELYYYRVDAHPIVVANYNEVFFIRTLLVISIMSITILVSRPYVKSNDMKYELQRANHLIKIFVAQITHELRTPLDSIHYITQLLRKEVQRDDNLLNIKPLVDVGFTISSNARSIVNNVLDMAEIEAGKEPAILNEAFKVVPFIEKIMEVHRIIARREEMRLNLQIHPNMPEVIFSDPLTIHQILTNLLTNAFKYGLRGKTVNVEVKRRDHTWELNVSNYGPEIPSEKIDSIFDPFFTSRTGHIQGSGLGLYIVKTKVGLMGGVIRVEAQPGYTTFKVTLPLREGKLRDIPDGAGSDADTGDFYKARILVAEDDKVHAYLFSRFLKDMGCSFSIFRNGQELLEALKKCPDDCPDIIIIDCHMPILNGEEAIRELKKTPGLSHIPIIVTTGDIYSDTIERMLEAGASTFLKKPIDHTALQKTILLYLKKLPQN